MDFQAEMFLFIQNKHPLYHMALTPGGELIIRLVTCGYWSLTLFSTNYSIIVEL